MERGISLAIEKFGQAWSKQCHPDTHTLKVLSHIHDCRTEVMGGRWMACPECGADLIAWNSCRDRHCPTCQSAPREAWLLSRKEELLPVTYFHVVFTIPACLNTLILKNKAEGYSTLFSAAWDTLQTFAKTHGVQIGMTALLHTWGSNLAFHPHLHCIVTGGGARLDNGKWKNLPRIKSDENGVTFLFPVKALSSMFRAKFISQLSNKVSIDYDIRESCFKKTWVVYAKPPVKGVEKTLEYLTRYAYRVAISDQRIKAVDDNNVVFEYMDYRDNQTKTMILNGVEFIRRYAQHILPSHFVRIRHYGILAPGNRDKLGNLQEQLGAAPIPKHRKRKTWKDICKLQGREMGRCEHCKCGILILVERIPRIRSPERVFAYEAI